MRTINGVINDEAFQIFVKIDEPEVHNSTFFMFIQKKKNAIKALQMENKTPHIFHIKRDL